VVAVSDLEIAAMLFAFLGLLAIAAPIWGVDSRDGVASDQAARRVTWLHDRGSRLPSRSASVALAGALRQVAFRLDDTVADTQRSDRRLAEAC
jgi:hypothetical protein